jgi:hypothetical protein
MPILLSFLILRHVRNAETNRLWIHAHECIRKHHPDSPIVIIDDHSHPEYSSQLPTDDPRTTLFHSPCLPGRGELVPYLYLTNHVPATRVVIIHDSVFLQRPIDLNVIPPTQRFCPLWWFDASHPDSGRWHLNGCADTLQACGFPKQRTLELVSRLILPVTTGCFGAMAVVDPIFVAERFTTTMCKTLITRCHTRHCRMEFERVVALILKETNIQCLRRSLWGHIGEMPCNFKLTYDDYIRNPETAGVPYYSAIKVWSGR